MNYCVYLKKRKGKPFCKLVDKEIPFSWCQECDKKEYNNRKNVKKANKKCTISVINGTFYNKNAQNNKKSGQNLRNRSKKLAKLERDRFSIFTDDMNKCYFCENPRMDKHEIYRGKNRSNSMKFGFVLPMCRYHHDKYQEDVEFNDYWHRKAQKYYEDNIGSREEFLAIFRRNYLIQKKDLD